MRDCFGSLFFMWGGSSFSQDTINKPTTFSSNILSYKILQVQFLLQVTIDF